MLQQLLVSETIVSAYLTAGMSLALQVLTYNFCISFLSKIKYLNKPHALMRALDEYLTVAVRNPCRHL